MIGASCCTQPVGEWALFAASRTKKDDSGGKDSYEGRERLRKWHESCWKMTVYTILTALALAVSYGEPWFSDSRHFWLGCTRLPCDLYVSKGLLLFYCVEIGFYIQVRGVHCLWGRKPALTWIEQAPMIATVLIRFWAIAEALSAFGRIVVSLFASR